MVGKKKRNHPDVEELLARPWCYYCERDFDDLKILISHQKAKHFKCERCGRRLNTAGGLSVHMNQVHKETLTSVDHSLPNRQGLEVEIFGMEGIPEDVVQAHNQRIIAGFYQAEAERRAATGNPGPGGAGNQGGQPKKPKFESPSDLKKRLAEHKARKAEQAAAGGGSSGANTPGADQNSPMGQSPATFHATPFPSQSNFNGSQGAGYGSFSQEPYAQPAVAYQQPFTQQQQPPFSGPPGAQYQPQYSPPQQYASTQSFPPSFPAAQQFPGAPPNTYGTYQGPPSHEPVHPGGLPNRPPSLPPAPGLPQRPSFATPTVPTYQMQQLHQGPPPQAGWNGNGWKCQDQKPAMSSAYPSHSQSFNGDHSANAASVDDLVSGAAREADDIDAIIRMAEAGIKPPKKVDGQDSTLVTDAIGAASNSVRTLEFTRNEVTDRPEQAEKKTKKDKPIKMIYSDNELSPEERMAMMPRYAFIPDEKTESSLADIAALPGVARTFDS